MPIIGRPGMLFGSFPTIPPVPEVFFGPNHVITRLPGQDVYLGKLSETKTLLTFDGQVMSTTTALDNSIIFNSVVTSAYPYGGENPCAVIDETHGIMLGQRSTDGYMFAKHITFTADVPTLSGPTMLTSLYYPQGLKVVRVLGTNTYIGVATNTSYTDNLIVSIFSESGGVITPHNTYMLSVPGLLAYATSLCSLDSTHVVFAYTSGAIGMVISGTSITFGVATTWSGTVYSGSRVRCTRVDDNNAAIVIDNIVYRLVSQVGTTITLKDVISVTSPIGTMEAPAGFIQWENELLLHTYRSGVNQNLCGRCVLAYNSQNIIPGIASTITPQSHLVCNAEVLTNKRAIVVFADTSNAYINARVCYRN
jgi:hypothetical protein